MTAVITFTGGVDSTHLLWRHLTNTGEDVIALSLDYGVSRESGYSIPLAEASAGVMASGWLNRNVREFEYRRIAATLGPGEMPSVSTGRELGRIVGSGEADRALMAKSLDSNSPSRGQRTKRAILRTFHETAPGGILEYPLFDAGLSKVHAHIELPPALMALTSHCKNPHVSPAGKITRCGRCTTGCWYNDLIIEKLAEGHAPEAIFDLSQRLMRKGIYENLPVADPTRKRAPYETDRYDFPEMYD